MQPNQNDNNTQRQRRSLPARKCGPISEGVGKSTSLYGLSTVTWNTVKNVYELNIFPDRENDRTWTHIRNVNKSKHADMWIGALNGYLNQTSYTIIRHLRDLL